jgi:hypothetical protein
MSMLRGLLGAALVLAVSLPARAADGALDGTYKLAFFVAANEYTGMIAKLDTKDGKLQAETIAASSQMAGGKVTAANIEGKLVRLTIKTATGDREFEGVVGADTILGSLDMGTTVYPAMLVKTTDKTIAAPGMKKLELAELDELNKSNAETQALIAKLQAETDAEKKSALNREAMAASRKAAAEAPKAYREVFAKHPESPALFTMAPMLLRDRNAKPEEARAWIESLNKLAPKYGPRMDMHNAIQLAELLAGNPALAAKPGMKEIALDQAKKAESLVSEKMPTETKYQVYKALLAALKSNGKTEAAKETEVKLAALDRVLDTEYLAKMPPFKVKQFEGRKAKSERAVVMELFTGAQCPPCVAADVAFDAMDKTYKHGDVILLQYHMHIPGPDPLTNADTEARWKYYADKFPQAIRGTPSTIFNGKPQAGGGGGMANAEKKYGEYRGIIDPLLENETGAKLNVRANRAGNKIEIKAEVSELSDPGQDKKLRLVLVEEIIRYVGGNRLRFHHHVVRDLPGGPDGIVLKDKSSQHSVSVNLDELRAKLVKYLDDYPTRPGSRGPFPNPDRPLDFKDLRVVAIVQDDATREILQAVEIPIGGEATTKLDTGR